nr:RNaseH domain-containing protein [Streptomyces lavendulae]
MRGADVPGSRRWRDAGGSHPGPRCTADGRRSPGTAQAENRVFASTASTPHTVAKLPKGLMKLVPTAQGRTAPGKTAWNPGQLQVTVLDCLSEKALADSGREGELPDRPAEWATLTHQLRYHDDYPPLARPLPLHLARLAGQYVLPLAEAKGRDSAPSTP